jgi:tRNA (guanine37-N1)-methyltransferase
MWRASVLTLFPDIFPGPLSASLAGKALAAGVWSLDAIDIRAFATDKHRTVDDTPAGGGPGMVMKPDVLARAIDATAKHDRPRLLLSPRGAALTQARVEALARGPGIVLVCGRFEGVDERVIAARALEEVSIGDYVLSGGETAALVLIDACVRLLPGVMGASAAITARSPPGGAPRPSASPANVARISGSVVPDQGQSCEARMTRDGKVTKPARWRRSCANPRKPGWSRAPNAQPMENSP